MKLEAYAEYNLITGPKMGIKNEVDLSFIMIGVRKMFKILKSEKIKKGHSKIFLRLVGETERYLHINFLKSISIIHSPSYTGDKHKMLWELNSTLANTLAIFTKFRTFSKSINKEKINILEKQFTALLESTDNFKLTDTNSIRDFNKKLQSISEILEFI